MSYGMPRASSEVGTFGSRRRTCCPTSVSSHQSIANRAAAAADYGTIYSSSAALADNWMRKHEPYDAGALHTPTGTITYLNDRSPVTYLSAAGDSRRSGPRTIRVAAAASLIRLRGRSASRPRRL